MNRNLKALIALVAAFSLSPVAALAQWSNPTATPTGGNTAAPLNVSSTAQSKAGGVIFNTGGATYGLLVQNGNVGIGNLTPSYKLQVAGSVGATSFFYTSDKSLKTDIKPLSGSLEKILKLEGVSFSWKADGEKSVGLVAQDVERVYPELVGQTKEGIKSVEYANLVAPLIEAVKEQQKEIEALKAEVKSLKESR